MYPAKPVVVHPDHAVGGVGWLGGGGSMGLHLVASLDWEHLGIYYSRGSHDWLEYSRLWCTMECHCIK